MARDIDQIIHAVREQVPEVEVSQWQKILPADDDGLWWFSFQGSIDKIQIESPDGNCPFIVETDELCCNDARSAASIADAVSMIVAHLGKTLEAQG